MDGPLTVRSRDNSRGKTLYSLPTTESYKPSTTQDESFPRTMQHPLSLGSPLPDQFTIWPPTPRNVDRPNTSGAEHYSYSTAEDVHEADTTTSPWDSSLSVVSHRSDIPSNDVEVSRSYSASADGNEAACPCNIPQLTFHQQLITATGVGRGLTTAPCWLRTAQTCLPATAATTATPPAVACSPATSSHRTPPCKDTR